MCVQQNSRATDLSPLRPPFQQGLCFGLRPELHFGKTFPLSKSKDRRQCLIQLTWSTCYAQRPAPGTLGGKVDYGWV